MGRKNNQLGDNTVLISTVAGVSVAVAVIAGSVSWRQRALRQANERSRAEKRARHERIWNEQFFATSETKILSTNNSVK